MTWFSELVGWVLSGAVEREISRLLPEVIMGQAADIMAAQLDEDVMELFEGFE